MILRQRKCVGEFVGNKVESSKSNIKLDLKKFMDIMHCKTAKLQNCKTAKLQNCKTAKLQNCKTAKLQNCKTIIRVIFCFFLQFPFVVQAATVDITAEFAADISKPQNNQFTNTTPVSGYCVRYNCASNEKSFAVSGVWAEKYLDYLSPDLNKHHPSFTFDSTARTVTLTDTKTGNSISAVFRFAMFGATINRLDANNGILSDALSGLGTAPLGGCDGNSTAMDENWYRLGWRMLQSTKLTCYRKMNNTGFQGKVNIDQVSIGYLLTITPKPLNILAGTYEGDLIYTIGDNGDLDFHADATFDNEIRIHLKATVEHAFFIKFAPGSENVLLGAQGGWEPWMNGGHIPQSLSKEVPFIVSSSSKFTVKMQCGIDGGNQNCGIENTQTNEKVPVEVRLTLPGFKSNGTDVNNLRLTSAANGAVIDPPGAFITYRRSHVDFRVLRPAVETMVKAPGSTWKGSVTLVFDAQTQ